MSWKRFEDIFPRGLEYLFKMSWRCLEDIFARRLEDVIARLLEDSWNVLKTSSELLEDVWKMSWTRFCKTPWRRLENVLKMYGQDEYIGLDQNVFWRRMTKANIFFLIKTSSSRRIFGDNMLCRLFKPMHLPVNYLR